MKVLVVLGLYLVVPPVMCFPGWEKFKMAHNKSYGIEEESTRLKMYKENKKKISDHNEKHKQGQVTFKVNINKFSDMSKEEIKAMMNGYPPYTSGINETGTTYVDDSKALAGTKDWRSDDIVTPVKDHGQCDPCWPFLTFIGTCCVKIYQSTAPQSCPIFLWMPYCPAGYNQLPPVTSRF